MDISTLGAGTPEPSGSRGTRQTQACRAVAAVVGRRSPRQWTSGWWGVGEGGAVGSDELGVGGGALEFPSLPVDEGVVVAAEKDQVVEVGGAVVLPPGLDVVGVAPGGGAAT